MLQNFPKLWVWTIKLICLECYVMYSITALRFNLRVAYFSWEGVPPGAPRRLVLCSVEWIRLLNSYLTSYNLTYVCGQSNLLFIGHCVQGMYDVYVTGSEKTGLIYGHYTLYVLWYVLPFLYVCAVFSVHMCYTKSLIPYWTLLIILKIVMIYWFKRLNIVKSKNQVKFCIWNKTEFSCPITCMHALLYHKHWICSLKLKPTIIFITCEYINRHFARYILLHGMYIKSTTFFGRLLCKAQ